MATTSPLSDYSAKRRDYGLAAVLDVEETAAFLRLSTTTIYVAVRNGQIPSTLIGRQYRIYTDRLLRWLDQGGHITVESDTPRVRNTHRKKPTIRRRNRSV